MYRDIALSISVTSANIGDISNLVVIGRDVTNELRLEKQMRQTQKMESIGTLAGGIAHDFNNLLTGILGHTSLMLLDTPVDDPKFSNMKEIENIIKSASNLTKQLLGFARGGKYNIRPIELNKLIKRTSADVWTNKKRNLNT